MTEANYKLGTFGDQRRLILRLIDAISREQKLSFLLGSAITAHGNSIYERGVPGVKAIIQRVRESFTYPEEQQLLAEALDGSSSLSDQYQRIMQFVLDCRGPEELNRLVQGAVLASRKPESPEIRTTDEVCMRAEADIDSWSLRPGVEAIGGLLVRHPECFSGPILTTNFDPLIEVSIRRAGGRAETIFLSSDGRFDNYAGHEVTRVVHLHGYWVGSDMLHTPHQLTQERPRLKGCLRDYLRNTTLIIIGYGGWDDVVTRTLIDTIAEGGRELNVIWTFYSTNEAEIREHYAHIFKGLGPAAGQRVIFYKGIDCHTFLPQFTKRLNDPHTLQVRQPTIPIPVSIDSRPQSASDTRQVGRLATRTRDVPPISDVWVGRVKELHFLKNTPSRVVAITGIGGQGKSTLAAHYLRDTATNNIQFDFWDWRDCREESNRIHTQLIDIIEHITQHQVTGGHLAGESVESVVQTLFHHLGTRRALFVFDNIDHYIDLETFQPTMGMGVLLSRALDSEHNSKFIFTCRPVIRSEHSDLAQITLSGLTCAEAQELFDQQFKKHSAASETAHIKTLSARAYDLTLGHTLWLNLLAVQAARKPEHINDLISKIDKARASGLPDNTLRSIWASLPADHQIVLRSMAEITRAETEERLAQFAEEYLRFKRFHRVLHDLRDLSLVVVKSAPNSQETFDLHPLIRQFVRHEYHRQERDKFIKPIVSYYHQMVIKLKSSLSLTPTLAILTNWTHKAELEVNHGSYGEALKTLNEARESLIKSGYAEEYVRVSTVLFNEVDWTTAIGEELPHFHDVLGSMIHCMADLGRTVDVDALLDRYSQSIPGKDANYIRYCDLRCYANWYRGDFKVAIEWGHRGHELKSSTNVDTHYDCAHNLALAQRDGGEIDAALAHFLGDSSIEDAISNIEESPAVAESVGRGAAFYGNIGRCLWLKGNIDAALIFYKRSAVLLEYEDDTGTISNRGYARQWIGEALFKNGQSELAYCFLRAAIKRWSAVSPPRVKQVEDLVALLRSTTQIADNIIKLDDGDIENRCRRWLRSE